MGKRNFLKTIANEFEVIFGQKHKNKVYTSCKRYNNADEAIMAFQQSVEKLFDVNKWSELSGLSSKFSLYNSLGERRYVKKPDVGDFIKIELPGPFPENWVTVTNILEEDNAMEFTVSPSIDPRSLDKNKVKHFFADEATSTFRVERNGTEVKAYEIGRNEGINNKGEDAGDQEILNTFVAEGGWAGFQRIQWKKLTEYLVNLR